MSNIHQKTMNYIYVTHLKHGMRLDNGHNSEEKILCRKVLEYTKVPILLNQIVLHGNKSFLKLIQKLFCWPKIDVNLQRTQFDLTESYFSLIMFLQNLSFH